jgi:hypothetical protein
LENLPNLAQFHELNVFERNNWNNSDVAAYKRETIIMLPKKEGDGMYPFKPDTKLVDSLIKAVDNKVVPKLVGISPMSEAGRSNFIVFTYEDLISKEQRILRRKTGNTDHQHKVLMQKVYTKNAKGERTPLLHITEDKGNIYTKFVFKAVNAWGDSFRAQEFYTTNQQSVLDNGFDKVNEVKDDVIVDIYRGGAVSAIAPVETVSAKPEGVTQKEWDALSQEEKNKINEC